ncbi:hypothetical protein Dthio_PD0099 [Desulfonatronospira thiodismutans ASO3-1]|uniref:Uncharacterized protein n=1 Tax=Desulfonatronospira thiodismutans ASO3-1 TaxID=555779 RepID=D6SV45_9BACT|nr:hypothetical protein Dthio_PD0099 [Desulfonatronospira thiodismutans ASO3-1]
MGVKISSRPRKMTAGAVEKSSHAERGNDKGGEFTKTRRQRSEVSKNKKRGLCPKS